MRLGVHRVKNLGEQGRDSVFLELLFGNDQLPGMGVVALSSPAGRGWRRLGDVQRAAQQGVLAADEAADLDLVLQQLPGPWRRAVEEDTYGVSAWQGLWDPFGARWVLEGPDPTTGQVRLWEQFQTGRLEPLMSDFVRTSAQREPAMVRLVARREGGAGCSWGGNTAGGGGRCSWGCSPTGV
jgi:hypothetical protein